MKIVRKIQSILRLALSGVMLAACSDSAPDAGSVVGTEVSGGALSGYVNSVGMEFVRIPAGDFFMGTSQEPPHDWVWEDEFPSHSMHISESFYLGKHEVTQSEWEAVMGKNPSHFQGADLPVENVSWDDIQIFIQRLNRKEETERYRLPTEAEWEYAARAGTTTFWSFGNKSAGQYAWYSSNSDQQTHPVGQKEPNPWGLYDMHGNVWEWVEDWYDETYYAKSPATDATGPAEGIRHVLRGGGWDCTTGYMRSAIRSFDLPENKNERSGFRLAFSSELLPSPVPDPKAPRP
ncbi:MAG: formylglycine-generating enzyme family protein [Zoogloeaceae bacterium]|nr:formylglycine-generating enzyme family protein [Zoogloeaceae bacterium]